MTDANCPICHKGALTLIPSKDEEAHYDCGHTVTHVGKLADPWPIVDLSEHRGIPSGDLYSILSEPVRYADDVECTSPRGHHYGDRIHAGDNLGQRCMSCGAIRFKEIRRRVEVNVPYGMTTSDFLIEVAKISARSNYLHADDQTECDHRVTFKSTTVPDLFMCELGRTIVKT